MEFFPAGFAAGIGAGIAIGMSSGMQQARKKVRDYFESRGITLHDATDKPIVLEQTLDEAFSCGATKSRTVLITALLLGCVALAAGGVVLYLIVTRG